MSTNITIKKLTKSITVNTNTYSFQIQLLTAVNSLTYIPENIANKNQPNGYAGLDVNGLIPVSLLPGGSDVISVFGRSGVVIAQTGDYTKTQVGLGNLDNIQQMPLTYLDTDSTFTANSDTKVPSQKAVKTAFATKQNTLTLGNLTEVTSAILTILGGSAAIIGSGLTIQVQIADTTHPGYLTSADWNTFNSKQAALGFTAENAANKSTNTSLGASDILYPTQNAVKTYIDTQLLTKTSKDAVQAATTTTLPANTYNNGASGVGATLIGTLTGVLVIDGHTVALNDRILVKNEAAPENNGIYKCTLAGAVGVAYILTRAIDSNSSAEIIGESTLSQTGTVNALSGWLNTNTSTIIMGTTAITYTQFNGTVDIIAGNGISKSGNTLSADVDGTTISFTGTHLTVPAGGIAYTNIQNVSATSKFLGRKTAGAGVIEELSAGDAKTILAIAPSDLTSSDFGSSDISTSGSFKGSNVNGAHYRFWQDDFDPFVGGNYGTKTNVAQGASGATNVNGKVRMTANGSAASSNLQPSNTFINNTNGQIDFRVRLQDTPDVGGYTKISVFQIGLQQDGSNRVFFRCTTAADLHAYVVQGGSTINDTTMSTPVALDGTQKWLRFTISADGNTVTWYSSTSYDAATWTQNHQITNANLGTGLYYIPTAFIQNIAAAVINLIDLDYWSIRSIRT